MTAIRLSNELRQKVDEWADDQEGNPGRSEAIRRLLELGLTVAPSKPIVRPGRRSRAQELAKDAINNMADPGASPDEHAERRRRLTKGPPEFREVRLDLPKVKGK